MLEKRSETMREIRRDLIETMRRIEEKGEHRVLVDRQWMEILAAHPREEKEEEQIGVDEKRNENIIDNNEKVKDENGSFIAIEPLLSRGPSCIRVTPSTFSIDVKNPEKSKCCRRLIFNSNSLLFASLVTNLKKLQAVCRSFESVLSGVLPLSETCVANNKNDGEERIETVAPNTNLLNFLEEFNKEMSPAVSNESVVSSTASWISWLPRPMVDHLDGKLLAKFVLSCYLCISLIFKSESAIVQEPQCYRISSTSSISFTCNCHLCSYVNGWSMSSIKIDKAMEKLSTGCSCKLLTNGSLFSPESSVSTTDKFEFKDSFYGYDDPSNVVTKEEEMKSRKRPVELCLSDCSCKIVPNLSKKLKLDVAAAMDSIQNSVVTSVSSSICTSINCAASSANTISERDCEKNCVTQVSSWTTSGYLADSETTLGSEIKLGCTCTASAISMPVVPPTTPAIEGIDQLLAVQAPTVQTVDQARQFLEHKKALWTLLFIVCDTGIKAIDEALSELGGDC